MIRRTHAAGQQHGFARLGKSLEEDRIGYVTGADFPRRYVHIIQQIDGLHGEWGTQENQSLLRCVVLQPTPLTVREFHPPPIVIARLILRAEFDSPRLAWRAFSRGDVRLKLDDVGTSGRDSIDVSMGRTEAAVVRLRDFGN
jgi:hypothetical protein